jgi:hypothetical protein
MKRISRAMFCIVLASSLALVIFIPPLLEENFIVQASPYNGMVFSDPFGNIGYSPFQPRITYKYGILIENTDFDVHNPDLRQQSSCFGVPWEQLWHAGADLYDNRVPLDMNGFGSTSGAEV